MYLMMVKVYWFVGVWVWYGQIWYISQSTLASIVIADVFFLWDKRKRLSTYPLSKVQAKLPFEIIIHFLHKSGYFWRTIVKIPWFVVNFWTFLVSRVQSWTSQRELAFGISVMWALLRKLLSDCRSVMREDFLGTCNDVKTYIVDQTLSSTSMAEIESVGQADK